MSEARIGRVLVASLHQGISDVLPTRLAFYESWLDAQGLRDGTIGLAPLYAVLSFLRQEGSEAYETITTCAGVYAAEWTVESMPPLQRRFIKSAPAWLRGRRDRREEQDVFHGALPSVPFARGVKLIWHAAPPVPRHDTTSTRADRSNSACRRVNAAA